MFSSRSDSSLIYPRGWGLVLTVALAAAMSIVPLCLLAQMWSEALLSAFWPEFYADIFAAGVSFLVVLCAPLWVRLTYNWPWRAWGEALIRNRLWLIIGSFVGYAGIMKWATHGIVYTPDEYMALLQARTLAAFHLTPQVDPPLLQWVTPRWMQVQFAVLSHSDGRYSAIYWPGYALVMAPFAAFGLQWLCNPALSALTLWLMWALGKRLTQSNEGGLWALVMTLGAAQIALQAATYFSMPAHLAFNLLFCWLITNNTTRSTFLAGLVGGFALILHNPGPHLSFALPWIAWIALRRRHQLLPLLAGYALIALPAGIGWSAHLGNFEPDTFSRQAAAQGQHAGRFSAVVSRIFYVLRPPDVPLLLARVGGLVKWIVWAIPGAGGLALLGFLQLRTDKKLRATNTPANATPSVPETPAKRGSISPDEARQFLCLFAWSSLSNFALYFLVRYDQGHGWGFRYIHQSWMALPLLAAAFLVRQNGQWKRYGAAFCLGGLLIVLPMRVWQMRAFFDTVYALHPPAPPSSPSISFIKERPRGATFILNDPFLRQPDWKLSALSPQQNARIARRYLHNPRRVQSDKWSEIWVGDRFARSGSPQFPMPTTTNP